MAELGYNWLYLAVLGCTWLYLAVLGCTWLYLAAHGCTWFGLVWSGSVLNSLEPLEQFGTIKPKCHRMGWDWDWDISRQVHF